ncbi:MAG: hypothetical protein OXB98_03650, partial [Bryobacterales bacterium]|nr:hypothetical protein [Bryobacterales bacterium]
MAIVRLLMLTGCRVGEIRTLEWEWIKGKRIFLPDSKSGPRTVWLSSAARAVIDAIPRYSEDCPYLFPGRPPTRPLHNITSHWSRIRIEAGLAGGGLPDLPQHPASVAALKRGGKGRVSYKNVFSCGKRIFPNLRVTFFIFGFGSPPPFLG